MLEVQKQDGLQGDVLGSAKLLNTLLAKVDDLSSTADGLQGSLSTLEATNAELRADNAGLRHELIKLQRTAVELSSSSQCYLLNCVGKTLQPSLS